MPVAGYIEWFSLKEEDPAVIRRFRFTFLILLWLGFGGRAQAQSAPAQQTPAQADGAVHITLGQSAVPLYGPWKFTVGDSPVDPVIHAPLWADWCKIVCCTQ